MKLYMAPMEGITGYIYRNAFNKYFDGVDGFYTPFIVGNKSASLKAKEMRDVLPENNMGLEIIPQILSCKSEEIIATAHRLKELGYLDININMGCPSMTVVSKGRGAGLLKDPVIIDKLLEEVFSSIDMKVSVKTRIGFESADEFKDILNIYSKHPLSTIIIHPRTRNMLYLGKVDIETFGWAYDQCVKDNNIPIIYNGDINTVEDYENICSRFPNCAGIMLGRGLIGNPMLAQMIKTGVPIDKYKIKEFLNELYYDYRQILSGDKDVLFKMKEIWSYIGKHFEGDSERYIKKIKKSDSREEYMSALNNIFAECDFK